ncbi:MAG: hypothetical protein GY793_01765 [Proteobacteria bacterium]|nr:hypothetical protein [Pseudomonadota bacterium]
MNNQKEVWKDVKDYEGHYQVSNLGRVKSLKNNETVFLKLNIDGRGYYKVALSNKGTPKTFRVHVLVAEMFLNHTPNGTNKVVVDHINNDRLNNKYSNLQLISNRENSSKDKSGGSSKYVGVSWNKQTNKWLASIRVNGKQKYLGRYKSEKIASAVYQYELDKLKENDKN